MTKRIKPWTHWGGPGLSVSMGGTGVAGLAPPPVEGWEHGSTVTLTPAMFGLATFGDDPNMRLFDTVDNQSAYDGVAHGADVPAGASYPWNNNGFFPSTPKVTMEISDGTPRHSHDSSRYRINGKSYMGLPNAMGAGHSFGRKLFCEWWYQLETPLGALAASKICRVWADNSGNARYSSWTHGTSYMMGRGFSSNLLRNRTDWRRCAVELDTSSSDILEWRGRNYVDGVVEADHFAPEEQQGGTQFPLITWGAPFMRLIGYDPSTSEGIVGRFTDIYIAAGSERFAITDSATYGPTQNYEVQEIVSWSPSSVQIRVFEGALNGLGGKYVHFVGEGNLSHGTSFSIVEPSGDFAAEPGFAIGGTLAANEVLTIQKSGGGFGATGPNIIVYDDFTAGADGANVVLDGCEVGAWTAISSDHPLTYTPLSFSGGKCMEGGATTAQKRGLVKVFTETPAWGHFTSYKVRVGANELFPGADTQRTFGGSSWKMTWHLQEAQLPGQSRTRDTYNVCLPTHTGSGSCGLSGNYFRYTETLLSTSGGINNFPGWWDWEGWNGFQSWVPDPRPHGNNGDLRCRVLLQNASVGGITRDRLRMYGNPPDLPEPPPEEWYMDRFQLCSWAALGTDPINKHLLYDDIYFAIDSAGAPGSANCRAELIDAANYTAATKHIILLTQTWANGQITCKVPRSAPVATGNWWLMIHKADGSHELAAVHN